MPLQSDGRLAATPACEDGLPQPCRFARKLVERNGHLPLELGIEVEKLVDVPRVLRTAGEQLEKYQIDGTDDGYVDIPDPMRLGTLESGSVPSVAADDDVDRFAGARSSPHDARERIIAVASAAFD